MKYATFNANCEFEIGDKIQNAVTGKIHTITDIACVHYCKSGKVEFSFELDNNKKYIKLEKQQPKFITLTIQV